MMERRDGQNDPLLQPLLSAATAEEREARLEALLTEHAYARIDRALDSRFRQSGLPPLHREDVRAEVLLRLVNRLNALMHHPNAEPVLSFCDYVAVVAFNTFDGFLRRSHPLRSKLKNRIRYALRHDPRLAEWRVEGEAVAALAHWPETARVLDRAAPLTGAVGSRGDLRSLLVALLEHARHPLTVTALVRAVAEIEEIAEDDFMQSSSGEESVAHRNVLDDMADAAFLRQVWAEICELPLRQRIALLLNARDANGESVIRFLPVTGIASVRQIGTTLAIEAAELAELWNELPLEDAKIGVLLQVTRQQVINLRQAARNRLARRLDRKPGRTGGRS